MTSNAREQSSRRSNAFVETSELDGYRRRTKRSSQTPQENDSWIYTTFKKKTCSQFIQFIPSENEAIRCCCGRLKEDHQDEALENQATSNVKWEVSKHTKSDGPTDAYGELEFTGAGQASRAKFIRISNDAKAEDVLRLFKEKWNLELPKLVISVTGGAKTFVMHPKLKHLFRQGLLKVAQTTGAWIMTGGTNTGVMRHVGKAVKGHTVMSRGALLKDKTSHVNLIGIATWGIVDHRLDLINSQKVVRYHMTSSLESEGSCIDNNHSHFILVDDGTEGQYGGEIEFRASLQNCLANIKKQIPKKIGDSPDDKSHGIPVVLVVLEGGPNTIETVLKSIQSNPAVPVVVAEGSGRAADILAYAYSFFTSNEGTDMKNMPEVVDHEILLVRIEKAFPKQNAKEHLSIYKNVLECVKNIQYITIFHMDEDGVDIDRAILRAFLKAQCATPAAQLDLALTWNRADIARKEIFKRDQKWKIETLENAMWDALMNNRVDFVKLLLENGVSMSEFLTTTRLMRLYAEALIRPGSQSRVVFEEIIWKGKTYGDRDLLDVKDRALQELLVGKYKDHGKVMKIVHSLVRDRSHGFCFMDVTHSLNRCYLRALIF